MDTDFMRLLNSWWWKLRRWRDTETSETQLGVKIISKMCTWVGRVVLEHPGILSKTE